MTLEKRYFYRGGKVRLKKSLLMFTILSFLLLLMGPQLIGAKSRWTLKNYKWTVAKQNG